MTERAPRAALAAGRAPRRLALAAGGMAALAVVWVGASSLLSDPVLSASIIEARDDLQMGTVTAIDVEVHNTSGRPISPRFSVPLQGYGTFWAIADGPAELGAGESARYTIAPGGAEELPPVHSILWLNVSDARSSVFSETLEFSTDVPEPVVRNPQLRFWESKRVDAFAGPMLWWTVRAGAADVAQAEQGGRAAVALAVEQDGTLEWVEAGLLQEIPFPECGLSATLLLEAPYRVDDFGWPVTVFGVALDDPVNPPIYFVPTSDPSREGYELSNGHHIEFVHVPEGQWSTMNLDVSGVYRELGWTPDSHAVVKVFVAAHQSQPGSFAGYAGELGALPCPAALTVD